MPRIAEQARPVTGGVDTHAGVHVAAAVDQVGRVLGAGAFPADAARVSLPLGGAPADPDSPRPADHKPGCWSL